MGKKRISVIGAKEASKKKPIKSGKGEGRITDMGKVALEEAERIKEKEEKLEKESKTAAIEAAKETEKLAKKVKVKKHGKKYLKAKRKVGKNKFYSLKESVQLVKETSICHFNGSVELHLIVKETGLSGKIAFPHSTGKEQKIVIADDKLIKKIQKGKIDFNVLVSSPEMMKKLAPLAKILGPKGLMPSPKKGTISENPQELIKKMAGKTQYKTEKKAPLVHLVVGKLDHSDKNLIENIQATLKAIGPSNVLKMVLTGTMGPGIKVDLERTAQTNS